MRYFKCIEVSYSRTAEFELGKVYKFHPDKGWSYGGYLSSGGHQTCPEPEYFREVTFNLYYEQLNTEVFQDLEMYK